MTIQQGRRAESARHALLPTPREVIEDDAAADGIPARWCWASFWWPFAGVVVFAVIFIVHRPLFYTVQLEDHPVEWAQFAVCAFASVVSFAAAVTFARSGRPGLAVLMVFVGLGLLGLTGEEISWGQRVFGVATPADLDHVNDQAELNLHNVDVGVFDVEDLFKIFEFVMGVVATLLSLLARPASGRLSRTWWWTIGPPLFALPGFVAIACYRAAMMLANVPPLIAFQEYVELTLYFSLAATAVCYYLRARAQQVIDLTGQQPSRRLTARPAPSLAPFVLLGAGLVTVTVVFAIMTVHSGILPGNLPTWARAQQHRPG